MTEENNKIDLFTPPEMARKAVNLGVQKANLRITQLIFLSILAGMYIAFGALLSSIVAVGMAGVWPFGIMKVLQGLVFSLGLILVIIGGAELFTGNSLMAMSYLQRKINLTSLLRNWFIVYAGNFVGSLIVAILVILGKEYMVSSGSLGNVMFTTAISKLQYGFGRAMVLGILCNTLVCLAIWLTLAGRSVIDKIFSIIFPITAFIAAGFEHSIANMYIIPLAILIKTIDPGFAASLSMNFEVLSWGNFFIHNLLPVTLGNIIGGTLFVGFTYFVSFRREISS